MKHILSILILLVCNFAVLSAQNLQEQSNTSSNQTAFSAENTQLIAQELNSKENLLDAQKTSCKELQNFEALDFYSLDEQLSQQLSSADAYGLNYQIALKKQNAIGFDNVENALILQGSIATKNYISSVHYNKQSDYYDKIYVAPNLRFESHSSPLESQEIIAGTVDFGYEMKNVDGNMEIFAGAGLEYNTTSERQDWLIVSTGFIVAL